MFLFFIIVYTLLEFLDFCRINACNVLSFEFIRFVHVSNAFYIKK